MRASCSESDKTLVVKVRPSNQRTPDWDGPFSLLVGNESADPLGKKGIKPLPLCAGSFANSFCRVVRYKTYSGSPNSYAVKPTTLPSNTVWTDRDLFTQPVDPLEIQNAQLLLVGDIGVTGLAHASVIRTPSATELSQIKARFDAGMNVLFFADNGVTPAPYWGDASRGTREILAGITSKMAVRANWLGDYDMSGTRIPDTTRYPFLNGVSYYFGGSGLYTPSDIYGVTAPAECVIQSGAKCRVAYLPKESGETHGEILVSGNANTAAQATILNFMKRVCPAPPIVLSSFQTLSQGKNHTCVVKSGALYCSAENEGIATANENFPVNNRPVRISGFENNVADVATGYKHTCAIRNGDVYCFGRNEKGQLGQGSTDSGTPRLVPGLPVGRATQVTAAEEVSCAIVDAGLYCWGANGVGELGRGTSGSFQPPGLVSGLETDVSHVSTYSVGKDVHVCAIKNGGAWCWGNKNSGAIGNPAVVTPFTATPVAVQNMTAGVEHISAGNKHTCAIQNGNAFCWGLNTSGQLGDGTLTASETPVAVAGLSAPVRSITAGDRYTCAIDSSYAALCWGVLPSAMLTGNIQSSRVPRTVKNMEERVTVLGRATHDSLYFVQGTSLYVVGDDRTATGASQPPTQITLTYF